MTPLLRQLFATDFVPHGYCMRWQSDVIGLHLNSDIAIALAYFSIPVLLVRFLRRRQDIRYPWLFAAFALFILACGLTHVMHVVTLWWPLYRAAGFLKALTAIVSMGTAAALVRIWPDLVRVPTTTQLEVANRALQAEIDEHRITKSALEKVNRDLLARVSQGLDRFKTTFESAAIGLAHVSSDGRFLLVNEHLCTLVGYSEEELMNLTFSAITHADDRAAGWDLATLLLAGERPNYSVRKRYVHKDGRILWAALHVSLVRGGVGQPDYFIAAIKDVTTEKESEIRLEETIFQLAERDRQLELIFERAEMGHWKWDIARDEAVAHAIVFRQYGEPEMEGPVPASWFAERQHPEDRAQVATGLREALAAKLRFDLEFRVIHRDGTIRWLACRGLVVRDEQGNAIATHGISLDITASKEAESAVHASQSQLLALTQVLPQMLWFSQPDGAVEFFNRQWYEYTGQSSENALDWGWQPVIHPDDIERCLWIWKGALTSGNPYDIEYRLRRADGSYRWHLGRALPVRDAEGQITRWFGSCTDIHDLKCAEASLRLLQEQLEEQVAERTAELLSATELNTRILESNPDCIQVLDIHGYLIHSNPAGCRALNIGSTEEVTSLYWPGIWPEENREPVRRAMEQARRGGAGTFRSFCTAGEGEANWWDVRLTAIRDAKGQPERLLADWRDTTAQRRAEEAAAEAKGRLELALRGAQIGAWTWDIDNDRLHWHEHCAAIFGLQDVAFTTSIEYFTALVHPDDRAAVESKLTSALYSGHYEAEYRVIWPDGTVHVMSAWAELSCGGEPAQMAGICWDITTRKQAEEALQISESRLKEAQQTARLGHWEFDLRSGEIHWSDETFWLFGVAQEDGITYEAYQALLPAEDRERIKCAVEHTIATREPYELTHKVLCSDGSSKYIDARGRLECAASGEPLKLLGTALDVTARVEAQLALQRSYDDLEVRIAERTRSLREEIAFRKATEKSLRDAERRLAVALRFSGVTTWVWEPRGDVATWTGPVDCLFGRTAKELSGLAAFKDLIVAEDFEEVSRRLQASIATGGDFEVEYRIRRPDGTIRWIAGRGGAASKRGLVTSLSGVNFDITEKKIAEQEVAASERRFRQLADGMPQIVWTARADGWVDYVNNEWSSYTGMTLAETQNWGWTPVQHPDDEHRCVQAWETAFETGSTYEVEFRLRRVSDGAFRWHLGRAMPIRDADGYITKWLGTCPDIHDYKCASAELERLNQHLERRVELRTRELSKSNQQLRRTQTWLQAVLDSATQASIIAVDNGGRITIFNSGAEKLLGYSAAEMLGDTPHRLYSPEYARWRAQNISAELGRVIEPEDMCSAENQPSASSISEATQIRKDSTPVEISLGITPMIDSEGERIGTLAIAIDIGARKALERQLGENNEQLQEQTRRAEEANRAKSDFLAAMSHEIRTPMNAILGMADLLWESELEPAQRQYVEIFRRAGGNLLTLVNDILDLSKIESGSFELEQVEFDLEELVQRTAELMEPRAKAKRLHLSVEIEQGTMCSLVGDPMRLQQILINLLGNAVKFTERGNIRLVIRPAGSVEGHLRFEVSDTGIGIPPGKVRSIFEDFTQAETSTTRRYGGTGLGLGICRRLVGRMGGEIGVQSDYGSGSVFWFEVRLGIGQRGGLPDSGVTRDLINRRVLIVDDSATNQIIFTEMCECWGMETHGCSEGREALDALRAAAMVGTPFELVIVDRFMRGGGFDFVAEALALDASLPIIITTTDEIPGEATRSQELGIAGYVGKPVRRAGLLRLICGALGSESGAAANPDLVLTKRLLIAEDSEDNRFLLQEYLKNTKYELVFAENGALAVELYRAEQFDLVLMDIQMPVMDGLTAARAIRSYERTMGRSSVPILALTANARFEDVTACKAAGCTSHLSKPIARARLLGAIEEYLPVVAMESSELNAVVSVPPGLEEAAKKYIRSRQNETATLKRMLTEGDFDGIRSLAHNIKGTGLPFGFPTLTELGGEIETAARERNEAAVARKLGCLYDYVAKAIELLKVL